MTVNEFKMVSGNCRLASLAAEQFDETVNLELCPQMLGLKLS